MKIHFSKLHIAVISWFIFTAFSACTKDAYNGIDNSGGVTIKSFTVAGVRESLINEESGYIELIVSSATDLTTLTPAIVLSDGAAIILPENPSNPVNLSVPTTYRVANGNLYRDYNVIAKHVSDVARIESFTIGKYRGIIDNAARTVTVLYPEGESLAALTPTVKLNVGATLVSPTVQTLDFSSPIKYTIAYLDETFTYTVSVVPTQLTPVAFIGEASSASSISNADEKAAWTWLAANFVDPVYLSFEAIKNGADLNAYGAIWYHCDPDEFRIPSVASDGAVIAALKTYYENGGGLLLTSAGIRLGVAIGISKDGRMWNNDWGYGNTPSVTGDDWGIHFAGHENHPIFKGLRTSAGNASVAYLIGKGVTVKGHNAIWNFDAWTGYNFDVAKWQAENGGVQLASFHWDEAMNQRCIITEYPRKAAKGAVITIAVESYDWFYENGSIANPYKDNIEKLTANILSYIAKIN